MYHLEDIKVVHLEMSEKCNLSCLMCDRNINGGDVNPYLKGNELTFDVISKALTPSVDGYVLNGGGQTIAGVTIEETTSGRTTMTGPTGH